MMYVCRMHMDKIKWRHSNLWSRYDLHVVGHVVVLWLWGVNLWRFVTLCR